jgi:hypothetical protein
MRGGTSKGPYFLADDLPADPGARDKVLLALMGSPDARQIDGLGGADSLTSKVALVSRSGRAGVDVYYLFAQVKIDRAAETARLTGRSIASPAKGLVALKTVRQPCASSASIPIVHPRIRSFGPKSSIRRDGHRRRGTAGTYLAEPPRRVGSKTALLPPVASPT